jgi:hypothetical protein
MDIKVSLKYIFERYRSWPYSNTGILILSLVLLYVFADYPFIKNFMSSIGALGYLGAFITGIFFVSIFTVAPASVILFDLANTLNPILVAILAGFGTVLGDYLIFSFLRDKLFNELKPLFYKFGGTLLKKLFLTPYFSWLIPIFGAVIIASPLPDETGITMLGLSKVKIWQFLLITFLLNSAGIFILVTIAVTT